MLRKNKEPPNRKYFFKVKIKIISILAKHNLPWKSTIFLTYLKSEITKVALFVCSYGASIFAISIEQSAYENINASLMEFPMAKTLGLPLNFC